MVLISYLRPHQHQIRIRIGGILNIRIRTPHTAAARIPHLIRTDGILPLVALPVYACYG